MKIKKYLSIAVMFMMSLVVVFSAQAQEADYRLQAEDVLQITVYEQPDLATRVRISSAGEIPFPLLGRIKAAGLTVNELKENIEHLLALDYLINPQVLVFIEEYHSRQVSVLGEVKQPGKYDLYTERETTLLEAIAMAGGFGDTADINGTRIIRNENGQQNIIPVKVTEITKKGMKEKDASLKPGDIVFVPESFF